MGHQFTLLQPLYGMGRDTTTLTPTLIIITHTPITIILADHIDKMKIKVEPKNCAAVQCLEDHCPWKRVCANHASAGDFRTEGGSRPILTLKNGVVHCQTIHSPGNGYEPHEEPVNVGHHPYAVQGCCDYNCVLWSELVEEVDAYEI